MARGSVNDDLEAVITVRVLGGNGIELDVDAILDTGFTGSLTLPKSIVDQLGFASPIRGLARMADGTISEFDVFEAEVMLDQGWVTIFVSAVGRHPLIGMTLLAGHLIKIGVEPGGDVEITPLQNLAADAP